MVPATTFIINFTCHKPFSKLGTDIYQWTKKSFKSLFSMSDSGDSDDLSGEVIIVAVTLFIAISPCYCNHDI